MNGLYEACVQGSIEAVQAIVEGGGVAPNEANGMMMACMRATFAGDHWQCLSLLLNDGGGADPNAHDALMTALQRGAHNCLNELLLDRRIRVSVALVRSLLQEAVVRNEPDAAQDLLSWMHDKYDGRVVIGLITYVTACTAPLDVPDVHKVLAMWIAYYNNDRSGDDALIQAIVEASSSTDGSSSKASSDTDGTSSSDGDGTDRIATTDSASSQDTNETSEEISSDGLTALGSTVFVVRVPPPPTPPPPPPPPSPADADWSLRRSTRVRRSVKRFEFS